MRFFSSVTNDMSKHSTCTLRLVVLQEQQGAGGQPCLLECLCLVVKRHTRVVDEERKVAGLNGLSAYALNDGMLVTHQLRRVYVVVQRLEDVS